MMNDLMYDLPRFLWLAIPDKTIQFLGIMLDHRVDGKKLRTFEELGKHAYPSAPQESFQSILLSKIPSLGFQKLSKDLEIDFCELLISIWTQCMDEEYVGRYECLEVQALLTGS